LRRDVYPIHCQGDNLTWVPQSGRSGTRRRHTADLMRLGRSRVMASGQTGLALALAMDDVGRLSREQPTPPRAEQCESVRVDVRQCSASSFALARPAGMDALAYRRERQRAQHRSPRDVHRAACVSASLACLRSRKGNLVFEPFDVA
jgi:hypothetical protein